MRLRPHVCLMTLIATAAWTDRAHAWYGPVCYPDTTRSVTLTLPSITGEAPGDIRVDFDDNDHRVSLGSVKASASVPNAHEVTLLRNAQAETGTFAVVLTSPRSNVSYKFEMEFRKSAAECQGAVIRVSGKDTPGPAPALKTSTQSRHQADARPRPMTKAPAVAEPALSEAKVSADVLNTAPTGAPSEPGTAPAPVAPAVPASAAAPLESGPAVDAPLQATLNSEVDSER